MRALFIALLFALVAVTFGKLRKTTCAGPGKDCDLFNYCCGKYVCKDYRCAPKGTKDNQIKWRGLGQKCDWFHHCKGSNVECQSHRCVRVTQKVQQELEDKLK